MLYPRQFLFIGSVPASLGNFLYSWSLDEWGKMQQNRHIAKRKNALGIYVRT